MGWKRVFAYYVLAAVIGGTLYVEHRMHAPTAPAESSLPPIVEFLAARIDEVRLAGGGASLEFQRVEGRWTVVRPAGVDIGSDLVEALLDTLTTIPPVEVLGAQSENLAQFGLAPPQFVLQLSSDGERVASVGIGKRNPTRTAVYARLDETGPVYLLGFNAQYYVELIVGQAGASG